MHTCLSQLLALTLVLSFPAATVSAQTPQTPPTPDGRDALRQLAAALAPIESIDIEWTPLAPANSNTSRPRTRVATHRDGRFAYEEFEPANSPHQPRTPGAPVRDAAGKATDEELRYFVFHDLTTLFTTDGDAGLYFKSAAAGNPLSLPPRQQYDLAPWPVVGPIVEQMLQVAATTIRQSGPRWIAHTPLDHNRSFELEWQLDPTLGPILTRIQRLHPDARFTTEFSNFSLVDGLALPARRIDDASYEMAGEQRHTRLERALLRVAINPPDIDERLRFDPAKFAMRYVDSSTGNVHTHEGGPILYNAHDLNAAFEKEHAKASLLGRSWFAGVLAAGAGSLALLWRKLRGRP